MSPSLQIDLIFRNVGRVRVRSGTHKVQVRDAMKQMLSTLYQIGRADVLRDIKSGQVSVMEVYERFRLGRIDQLPSGVLMRPLAAAWKDWMDGKEIANWTQHDYGKALERITNHVTGSVADLPAMMQVHRKVSRGVRARSFNKDRAACLSFLGSIVGPHHWLYGEIARMKPLKIPASRKMPVNPLTVEQAKSLAAKVPPQHLFSFWGLMLTGMRPEEWFEEEDCRWTLDGIQVKVAGTKRPASNRFVPRVGEIVRPGTKRLAFYRALRKASGNTVTPYDLRRTYAILLELAGIPTYRQDYYMGHGPQDMNALYKRLRDCLPYIEADGKAIEQVVATPQILPTSGEAHG